MSDDLEYSGSESPVLVIKPPKRSFYPLRPRPPELAVEEHAVSGPGEMPFADAATGERWTLRTVSYGAGLLRGQLVPETPRGDPLPSRSWAVEKLPDAVGTGEHRLTSAGDIVAPPLTIGGWRTHREALRFTLSFDQPVQIYGLGEKMGRLERSGKVWEMWNSDDPFHLPSKDPLYVSVPFALFAIEEEWVGFFLDAPARHYWDTRTPGQVTVDVEDGYLDFYVFRSEGPKAIVSAYTDLTGQMPLPPIWALGYHQSRYSYYPEENVRELARRFRREGLPGDVIHLDIDYMDGYRVFTWDGERFPDPKALIEELRNEGFRVVTIVDPGVKVDAAYEIFREGKREGYFCRYPDGKLYIGRVWPGQSAFPDFSREEVRRWWGRSHKALFDAGVSGIWNDMNEPADFSGDTEYRPEFTVPSALVAETDGEAVSFRRFHNLYGSGMNAATRFAFREYRAEERGFLLTRSGYAGIQRRAAIWTGDNHSWWEHLAASVPMLCNMGISGLSFVGADAGGFQENASPELFARWIAAASMTPFFRGHSVCGSDPHEPWSFGQETLEISRKYLRLRYELLPYIYTAFREAAESGIPIMRPLFLDWPRDKRARVANYEHLFGPALLVAPVVLPDQQVWPVYLPEGTWYDFWTEEQLSGPRDLLTPAPLHKLPLYVRGGSIIPRENPRLHTGAEAGGSLYLHIYPDAEGSAAGELYEDRGEGWDYQQGEYTLIRFTFRAGELSVEVDRFGYEPRWKELAVRVVGATEEKRFPLARESVRLTL
ncbi:MAG: TIM-barrel domain-containing protein [Spirochaetaceae bacterium]